MKKLLLILTLIICSTFHANAYCDFEVSGIGSSKNEFKKINSSAYFNESNEPQSIRTSIFDICDDKKLITAAGEYHFINKNLQHVNLTHYDPEFDHLENLKYYYGDPTIADETVNGTGYYYWKKSFKEIFLNVFNDGNNVSIGVSISSTK